MKSATSLHLGLIALTLVVCAFVPQRDSAVLLVPLGQDADGALARVQRSGGTGIALVGQGRLPGSLVVYPAGPVSVATFLQQGLLPIAAPAFLCSQPRT